MSAPMSKFSSHCMISGINNYATTLDHEAPVCAENSLTRDDVVSHPESSAGKRGPPSALRNGRGGALAEQFGSVTRRFPWSVIAVEALSARVFIHTCRILIMPGQQYLLGFRWAVC